MQGERLSRPASGLLFKSLLPVVLSVLASALAGSLPATAAAAPAWLERLDLSIRGNDAEAPQIALDAAGDATAVWRRFDGSDFVIQSADRPAGGSWSAPVDLSAAGEDASEPQLAVDPAGDAVVVWSRFDGAETGSHSIVQAASRPAGGAWSMPVDLSAAERNAEQPRAAVDADGDAIAVWRRFDGSSFIVQSASRPAGGAWGGPVDLSAAGHDGMDPQLALDPAGDAAVVWSRFNDAKPASHSVIQAASRPHEGAWEGTVDVSDAAQNAQTPQVAVDAAGKAVAVWSRLNGTDQIVQAAERPLGGTWSEPVDLSALGRSAVTPDVAVDPAGGAVAVWSRGNGIGKSVVQAAGRDPETPWQGAVDLSPEEGVAVSPEIALNAGSEAIAVWLYANGSPTVVSSSVRPAGSGWQPRTTLSTLATIAAEPQIALDPAGNGLATWTLEESTEKVVQAVGFDGAPPELRSLSIPSAATVRRPAGFSVAPFDVWSPIGSIAWSFDDGSSAAGPAVSHTFSTVGPHTVSVVAADLLGNPATATRSVTVFPVARAGHYALVRRGSARLSLKCLSPAGCEGRVLLNAVARVGRHGRRVRIGAASFSLAGAQTSALAVPLSATGVALVRGAMPKGLKAQLTGPGVKHRVVILRMLR
jgi:hypothetical protein